MAAQVSTMTPLNLDSPLVQNSIQNPTAATLNTTRPLYSYNTSQNNILSPARRNSGSPNEENGTNSTKLNPLELEAIAAVHEFRSLVKDVYVSDKLPRTPDLIYLNLTTIEGNAYCIELTTIKGWRVSSVRHDCMNGDIAHLNLHIKYFDTVQALMEHVSPEYKRKMQEIRQAEAAANPAPVSTGDRNSINEDGATNGCSSEDQTFT